MLDTAQEGDTVIPETDRPVEIPHVITAFDKNAKRTKSHHEKEHHGYKMIAIMSLLTIIFLLIGGAIYKGLIKKTPTTIESFQECADLKGSIVQEIYPEVCVTEGGQSFTRETAPSPAPSPTSTSTTGIAKYLNTKYEYSFSYPAGWEINAQDTDIEESALIFLRPSTNSNLEAFDTYHLLAVSVTETSETSSLNDFSCLGALTCPRPIKLTDINGYNIIKYSVNNGNENDIVVFNTETEDEFFPNRFVSFSLKLDNQFNDLLTREEKKEILGQITSTFKFIDEPNSQTEEGKFCGGIAANLPANQCSEGYTCKLDGAFPDAGGVCVKR